ncbi:hypothetical protein Syun_025837 [Stephania yunnanensis]|uniref:Plant heme peroxidase family profile domain-containing protein n=1 Tax=Stephania yunnanensis TaxID=152371 RepID=A0AAP0EXS4_9MAGN
MEAATRPSGLSSPSARDWSLRNLPRAPSPHPKPEDYKKAVEKARRKIRALISMKQCAPLMLQLAWHSAGTVDVKTKTGGPFGTMRHALEQAHGANKGLEITVRLLKPIKEQFPILSYADFYQLAGVIAVEVARGPEIPFHPGREIFLYAVIGLDGQDQVKNDGSECVVPLQLHNYQDLEMEYEASKATFSYSTTSGTLSHSEHVPSRRSTMLPSRSKNGQKFRIRGYGEPIGLSLGIDARISNGSEMELLYSVSDSLLIKDGS